MLKKLIKTNNIFKYVVKPGTYIDFRKIQMLIKGAMPKQRNFFFILQIKLDNKDTKYVNNANGDQVQGKYY